MSRHLVLRLDAPLMSFGGDTVDNLGIVRDHPAQSMVAGLIGNALGYERFEGAALARLQARIVMGSLRLREGARIQDFQTAQLDGGDRGWTTSGRFEGRRGASGTYESPHIRYRDADADAIVLVVLRLEPVDESPTLEDVKGALDSPERPLFLGRKPFIPSRPIASGWVDAIDIATALEVALGEEGDRSYRSQWPAGEGDRVGQRRQNLTDERDWVAGVHTGRRAIAQGRLSANKAIQS